MGRKQCHIKGVLKEHRPSKRCVLFGRPETPHVPGHPACLSLPASTLCWVCWELCAGVSKMVPPHLQLLPLSKSQKQLMRSASKGICLISHPAWAPLHPSFFFFLSLNYLFILLYNIVFVLPYIDLNPPRVCMWSPP